jgi:hypothetical protein
MAKRSEVDAAAPSIREFGKALWSNWFNIMCGSLSVPLTIAAFYTDEHGHVRISAHDAFVRHSHGRQRVP